MTLLSLQLSRLDSTDDGGDDDNVCMWMYVICQLWNLEENDTVSLHLIVH